MANLPKNVMNNDDFTRAEFSKSLKKWSPSGI
jgi:hypothetical protein